MMFGATKQRQRLAKLTVAVSSVMAAATMIALPGCDDPHQADRRVRDTIVQARLERAKGTPEASENAQKKLKEAAAEANAAAATQTHAKAMLAQAQYEAALADIADPRAGVDATNREIIRLIREINQLGQQIGASNSLVRVYREMEPKDARAAVQQRILEATGDATRTAWVGEGDAAIPTLNAVQQQVEQQQAAVDKQQELIKGLQAKQEQVTGQAQQAASQAEAARGRAGLDLFKQAVGLRKQAADLGNQIDVEQSKLAQLTHALKLGQARQQAVTTAIQQFQEAGKHIEEGWKGVEAQAVQQQQQAKAIVQGGSNKNVSSIADRAKALGEQLAANQAKYTAAKENLDAAIQNYEAAAAAANKLRSELGSKESALPSGNQMKVALKTMIDVYHPGTFQLGQATSQLALADLLVGRAQVLNERARLAASLSKVMSEAGLSVPQELNDPKLAAEVKETTEEANKNYTAALELFGTAGDGGGGDVVKKGGQSGKIYALYGQALLARASGGDAKEQLAAAQSARDLVIQESPGSLSALPAELVPPPSTQPAAATSAPAGGAATAPTDGTAAPATTPVEGATQPAEGAAPATTPAPADGAAPATPAATPPADGAAPATPAATPPADGAAAPATPGTDAAAPAPAPAPAPQ